MEFIERGLVRYHGHARLELGDLLRERSTLRPATKAWMPNRPGQRTTTSSVLVPMEPVEPSSVRSVTTSNDTIHLLYYSPRLLCCPASVQERNNLKKGAPGRVASGVLNEVSLALVGVSSPA